MNKKNLGKTGVQVLPLSLGTNVFGWTIDEKTSFAILDAFVAAGGSLIDTADVYSIWAPGHQGGESETIIGRWLKQTNNRDKIILATKVGMDMGQGRKGLRKKYILAEVETSLSRLQTEYIDLYQSHEDDPETPVEETLEAYSLLQQQGKIKWIGASNFSAARLQESLNISEKKGYPVYQTLQPEYNLYQREGFEKNLQQLCVDNEIGVINYFSLASGFLTGKYRCEADLSKSVRGGRMGKYMNEKGFRILKALDEVASAYNTSLASVAIAWVIAQPAIAAAISSATSVKQLDDLLDATRLSLKNDALELLSKASEWGDEK